MPSALQNFTNLASNPYPGRGLILGLDHNEEHLVQVYWIMGRSENSRNRVFSYDPVEKRLFTETADPSKVVDSKLTIYNAMRESMHRVFVVSNGSQTDSVVERVSQGTYQLPATLLQGWSYEDDAPNFTPRITGISRFRGESFYNTISIIRRKPDGDPEQTSWGFPEDALKPGIGHGLHTYSGDGNPLPAFEGDPIALPLEGDKRDILSAYWAALNEENLVSLAVKFIRIGDGVSSTAFRNRLQKI